MQTFPQCTHSLKCARSQHIIRFEVKFWGSDNTQMITYICVWFVGINQGDLEIILNAPVSLRGLTCTSNSLAMKIDLLWRDFTCSRGLEATLHCNRPLSTGFYLDTIQSIHGIGMFRARGRQKLHTCAGLYYMPAHVQRSRCYSCCLYTSTIKHE
jgi:hypothetical protein